MIAVYFVQNILVSGILYYPTHNMNMYICSIVRLEDGHTIILL